MWLLLSHTALGWTIQLTHMREERSKRENALRALLSLDTAAFSSLKVAGGCVEELRDENVLRRGIVAVTMMILLPLEELRHADVVVLQELDYVHALTVLLFLRHVGVVLEELGDGDVAVAGQRVLWVLVQELFEELDDRHVHVSVVLACAWVRVVRWCSTQVFGHCNAIFLAIHEFCD